VRTFFKKSVEWKEVAHERNPDGPVMERSVFHRAAENAYVVAEAYQGKEIKQAIRDFFESAAGIPKEREIKLHQADGEDVGLPSEAELSVYLGHDGLMDFALEKSFSGAQPGNRQVIVLACASKAFFGPTLRTTGAEPLLWTAGLMAPEAYTLRAALDGWVAGESAEQIRKRAAGAYAGYQKISQSAAGRLFTSGW
jgi:hypothetical protein